jgi:hypothetical protein
MKRRGVKKGKATFAVAAWPSVYQPGQRLRVRHHNQTVEAVLVRKKYQPLGAWICRKKIQGHWTIASIVNEIHFVKEQP